MHECIQGYIATTGHGVTRKVSTESIYTGNLF